MRQKKRVGEMFGLTKFFRKPKPDPITARNISYELLEQIGKRIDRGIEVVLVDGTVIRVFDKAIGGRKAQEYY